MHGGGVTVLHIRSGCMMQLCGCDTLNETFVAGMDMLAGGTMNTTFSSENDRKREGCTRRRRTRTHDDAEH